MTRLRSVTTSAIVAAISSVTQPITDPDVGGRRRLLEERVHARDQVDAGGDHRRRVDQGGDRGRALHRVREPGVERHLRRLRERADEQQAAAGHEVGVVVRELARRVERAEEVERAGRLEDEVGAEHQADVADDVDDERLDARLRRGRAPVPEADQQVGRRADERPADDQEEEVAGQDQQQHAEHEEVQVREEARVAARRSACRRPSTGGSASRSPVTTSAMKIASGSSRIESCASTPTVFA